MFELPDDTPKTIRQLPRDPRGFPIPFFVATTPDGTRDLRFADGRKKVACLQHNLCWVCGKKMNVLMGVLGGPLAVFNGRHGDLACHPSCAEFSVKHCPHLNNSHSRYRQSNVPDGATADEGLVFDHPGVIGITYCTNLVAIVADRDILVRPERVLKTDWWFEGRRIEAVEAVERWKPPQAMFDEVPEMVDEIRQMMKGGA